MSKAAVWFSRLSNRYGVAQDILLTAMPLRRPLLLGLLRKYCGIPVADLGRAMDVSALNKRLGAEKLCWDDFHRLCGESDAPG